MPADIGLKPAGEIPHGPGLRRADSPRYPVQYRAGMFMQRQNATANSMIMVPSAPPQRSTMEMVSINPADLFRRATRRRERAAYVSLRSTSTSIAAWRRAEGNRYPSCACRRRGQRVLRDKQSVVEIQHLAVPATSTWGIQHQLPRRDQIKQVGGRRRQVGHRLRIFFDRNPLPRQPLRHRSHLERIEQHLLQPEARMPFAQGPLDGGLEVDRIARRRRENLVRHQTHALGCSIIGHGNQRGAVALGRGVDTNPDG